MTWRLYIEKPCDAAKNLFPVQSGFRIDRAQVDSPYRNGLLGDALMSRSCTKPTVLGAQPVHGPVGNHDLRRCAIPHVTGRNWATGRVTGPISSALRQCLAQPLCNTHQHPRTGIRRPAQAGQLMTTSARWAERKALQISDFNVSEPGVAT
jgi:hypothetical protein